MSGWRAGGGARGGEQVPHLVPPETSAAGDGLVEGGAPDLHPGASVLPRQALRLLLPRRPPLQVSGTC